MRYLYRITNLANGNKCYIGQTKNFEKRMREHCTANKRISLINRAIKKYGKEAFTFEILAICEDHMIDDAERKAISVFDTLVPNGYNLETGGNEQKNLSEETKAKIRAKAIGRPSHTLGRKMSEEQRQKLIADNTGKILSDEHKAKISAGLKETHKDLTWQERKDKFGKAASFRKDLKPKPEPKDFSEITGIDKRRNRIFKNNTSGYIGVHLQSKKNKWIANIRYMGQCIYIGSYVTKEEAATAYNTKAIELYGDKANLNIIKGENK